jgi:hypothetical protein
MTTSLDLAQLRRWMYGLLILVAFGMACGRILSVQRVYEPAFYADPARWPKTKPDSNAMFGSNDRARWATIRSLVHDGTYVVGKRNVIPSAVAWFNVGDGLQGVILGQAGYDFRTNTANPISNSGIIFKAGEKEHGFATIDRVLNPDTLEFYSSKPPLLSTLLAGLYWVIYHGFGLSLIDKPTTVVRTILLLINGLPFAGYLYLLTRIAERWGTTDWGKLFIVASGAFATTVSPFLITLQNHTIGAFAVMLAWWSVLCIWDSVSRRETPAWLHFISAGFFSSFAFSMELPALAFAAAAFVLLLWWCPKQTLLLFLPMALIPAAAFFGTNYIAVGQLRPVQSEFKSAWYRYEGSHWNPPVEGQPKKTGIDWAKDHESRGDYVKHVLVGHHGLFSLTPIWLLAAAAMLVGCLRFPKSPVVSAANGGDPWLPWFVQPVGLVLSVVVITFYVMNDDSRNYGGFTNGLRWLMWLTPIWLTCLIPAADWLASRCWGRWLGGIFLVASVFSASYQLWSPWRHPWIFDLMIELGWRGY